MTDYNNVGEGWPLFDTMCVCSQFFGQESAAQGWFSTFEAMAEKRGHSFLKGRTEDVIGPQYCNKRSTDMMDMPFVAYSIGVSFFSPSSRILSLVNNVTSEYKHETAAAHYWEVELPRHCAISLHINQDKVYEAPCIATPPGYGPSGGGAALEHEKTGNVSVQVGELPVILNWQPVVNMSVTQGVPSLLNRWNFKSPFTIPKDATLEAKLEVSDIARDVLKDLGGPGYVIFNDRPNDTPGKIIPARFGIQVSLFGSRFVQQRGEYHR